MSPLKRLPTTTTSLYIVIYIWGVCFGKCFAQPLQTVPLQILTPAGTLTYALEVTPTPALRQKGLMFRKHLDKNRGMLFIFPPPYHAAMWMKNTYIPLDMLFVSPDKTIVKIFERTIPHSLESLSFDGQVRYVIELNAGQSELKGIRVGQKVYIPSSVDN